MLMNILTVRFGKLPHFFVACLITWLSSGLAEEIQLVKDGGVYHLPVKINDTIELKFVIDTGAADVHIPADVALTLIRTGTISKADFRGKASYQMADGSIKENEKFNLRSLKIGNRVIHNVEASVGSANSSLLLGQNALEELEPWRMETRRGIFIFNEESGEQKDNKNKIIIGNESKVQSKPGKFEEISWKKWSEWDRVTKSYVPIDGTIESSNEVEMALVTLNPSMSPFLFVFRSSSNWCGSAGCSLTVLKPTSGDKNYEPFHDFLAFDVQVRKDKTKNGWYSLVLGQNVLVYKNGKYTLP